MSRSFATTLLVAVALFFGAFFFYPIGLTVSGAFRDAAGGFTMDYVAEVFLNPVYREGLQNGFLLAVCSTAASILLALPLAWLADRFDFPGKKLLTALVLVPMILPPFVGAIGLKQILGMQGSLNALLIQLGLMDPDHLVDWLGNGRFWGIVALNALHLYPILFLNLTAVLANIDPALEEAAENLGCTGFRKFWKITLPLIMPGFFAGGTIVFIWAFTELGVPLMFDYVRVTPVQIFHGIKDLTGNPFPYALVVVMLISTMLLYLVSKLLFGRNSHAMMSKATSSGGARPAGKWVGFLCFAAFAGVTALAVVPHVGVVLVSISSDWYATIFPAGITAQHYHDALGHGLTVPSISNSLKYASISTAIDLLLGTAIAYIVVRTNLRARHVLDAVAMLPLAVPGLVLAFGYIAMTQEGRPFAWMNPTVDPTLLLVIAYSVRRLPYVVRAAAAGFQQTSVTLEEAAQNLGASPLRALRKITLPLITANLLAGCLLAFSFAMLEVSDSLILAQKQQHFPITKAIYELFQLLGEGRFVASALGVWAMVFLGTTILGASVILGKKLGSIFRI
ncbi:MAG TPA: iron ABC transporter permease [Chthoniobacterales bacterium]